LNFSYNLLTADPKPQAPTLIIMCGIIGYIGKDKNPKLGLELLKKLEYRGYDSAGLAVFVREKNKVSCVKATGKIKNLEAKLNKTELKGSPSIFHTRWATHGRVTERNAHPHCGCRKNIFLVHNGIVENYRILKSCLIEEGHCFSSETDTEVIAHLIEKFFDGNLEKAVQKALKFIKGTFGLAVIAREDPGKIVVARNSSPVLVGVGAKENIVSSDAAAIIGRTKRIIYLQDGEIAILFPDNIVLMDSDLNEKEKLIREIEWDIEDAQKSGFPHFMLKEIFDTPLTVKKAVRGRIIPGEGNVKLGGLEQVEKEINVADNLTICACGTSYYAGLLGEYLLEELAGVPAEVEYASEFRYREKPLKEKTVFLAISQSGETADTLAALRKAKKAGLLTLGIVNVVGSSIAGETDAGIYLHAGPEIGVASTKAFISELSALILLSVFWGRRRGLKKEQAQKIIKELDLLPDKLEKVLGLSKAIKNLVQNYKDCPNFLFIGRKYNFPVALEGALKLKEISYVHAEGCSAGEMKHGPIALIDRKFPTIAICPKDSVYEKTLSNIEEIKARSGRIIALATKGDKRIKQVADDIIFLPPAIEFLSPLLSSVALQLFAYHMSVLKGCDPDKPRNLAKSVTVE